MAEIKIDIKANASNAQAELDKLNQSLEKNNLTLSKARAQLIEEGTAVDANSKKLSEYSAVLKRHLLAINSTTSGAEQFTKVLKLLNSEQQKLIQGGASGNTLTLFGQAFEQAQEEAYTLQKNIAKAENDQKKLNEKFKEYKLLMTGSEVDLLENKYSKLEKKLDALIRKKVELEANGKSTASQDNTINDTLYKMNTLRGDISKVQSYNAFNTNVQGIEKQIQYYQLLGNSQAVARKQLEQYDLTLKQSIELFGVNSKQTQEALANYNAQKTAIDENAKSLQAYNNFLEAYRQSKFDEIKNRETEAQRAFNEQIREQMAIITGNQLEQYKIQYEKLEKQLKANVSAQLKLQKANKADSAEMKKMQSEAKQLASEMNKVETAMNKASKTQFSVRISNLLKSFVSAQAILWGVRKAFTFVTSTIKEAGEAASKAEETFNLFITVFDHVQSKAVDTASEIANAFGSANSTIQDGLGTFGDLIIGLGGTERQALKFAETATKLTMDITSFKNISGDLNTIFQKTASGLAGNLENFRKMGYIITQNEVNARLAKKGMDNLTGSALQLAQMQERLAILTEKATKAQGDMVRTLDSTENITRRLSEAWKEYKENLGSDVNKLFNPIKKWWLSILETQNEVNAVTKELAKNQEDIAQVASLDNDKSIADFDKEILRTVNLKNYDEAIKIMRSYGASIDDVTKAFSRLEEKVKNGKASPAEKYSWNYLKNKEFNFTETLQAQLKEADILKEKKQLEEDRLAILKEQLQSVSSFADELSSIKGISVSLKTNATDGELQKIAKTASVTDVYSKALNKEETNSAIDQILASLDGNIEKFSSAIEVALGKVSESDMLSNKQSTIGTLYEKFFNRYMEDGSISTEEQQALDKLIAVYEDTGKQIQRLADIESETKQIQANLSSLQGQSESLANQNELTNILKKIPDDIYKSIETSLATSKFNAEKEAEKAIVQIKASALDDSVKTERINAINKQLKAINEQLAIQYEFEKNKVDLEEKAKLKQEVIDGASNTVTSFRNQAQALQEQIDMAKILKATPKGRYQEIEAQKTYDLRKAYKENIASKVAVSNAVKAGTLTREEGQDEVNKLNLEYKKLVENIKAVAEIDKERIQEQQKQSAIALGGDTASLVTSIMGGDFISWLIDFASQLEIVKKVGTMLSDTVLPALNAFLEPLTETLEPIVEILQDLLVNTLQPFYSLIVSIAKSLMVVLEPVLDMINTIIKTIMDFLDPILDSLAQLIFTLASLLQPIIELVTALVSTVLEPFFTIFKEIFVILIPIIDAVTTAFKYLGAGLTYISAVVKKVAGSIITFFTGMINKVFEVLRSINILGWRPFGDLQGIDDSKYQEWKNVDPYEEMEKYLKSIDETNKSISDSNLEIKNNTSNDQLIKQLEKLYQDNLLTEDAYKGQLSKLTGQRYDQTHYSPTDGMYWQTSAKQTYISKGGIVLNISGDKDPKEIAKEVAKILSSNDYVVLA